MWSFGKSNKKTTLPSGNEIIIHAVDKVNYRKSDPGMVLQYSTYLDIENMELLQSEINEIWQLFQQQANDSGLNTVNISANFPPADKEFFLDTQQTKHFLFEKQEDGIWKQTKPEIDNTQEKYQIIFGEIKNSNDILMVYEDATSIPLLTRENNFYWGFTILPPNNEPYNYYCLFFPPKMTEMSIETGEIIRQITSENGKPGFRYFLQNDLN